VAISSLYDRRDKLSTHFSTKFFAPRAVLSNKKHNTQINKLRNHSSHLRCSHVNTNLKTLLCFVLSVTTDKIHNYISICIVYWLTEKVNILPTHYRSYREWIFNGSNDPTNSDKALKAELPSYGRIEICTLLFLAVLQIKTGRSCYVII